MKSGTCVTMVEFWLLGVVISNSMVSGVIVSEDYISEMHLELRLSFILSRKVAVSLFSHIDQLGEILFVRLCTLTKSASSVETEYTLCDSS